MKFRRLSGEELSGLKNEFIHFLIINGLDATSWEKLKIVDIDKAENLIDIFSDMVFEGIISKITYLEHFNKEGLYLFKCEETSISLTGIIPPKIYSSLEDMIQAIRCNAADFNIFHTTKNYNPDKNREIFNMLEAGAIVTEGLWYEHFQNQ